MAATTRCPTARWARPWKPTSASGWCSSSAGQELLGHPRPRRQAGEWHTRLEHYPPEKAAYLERTPERCRQIAASRSALPRRRWWRRLLADRPLDRLRSRAGHPAPGGTAWARSGWRRPVPAPSTTATHATGASKRSSMRPWTGSRCPRSPSPSCRRSSSGRRAASMPLRAQPASSSSRGGGGEGDGEREPSSAPAQAAPAEALGHAGHPGGAGRPGGQSRI